MVTPLSGPLSMFGRAAGEAVKLWAGEIVEPGWLELELFDAHPDPAVAVRRAEERGFDVLFGPYGRGPALAVAKATSRLVWNGGGATDLLSWPRFGNVVNVLAPASSYLEGGLAAIRSAQSGASTVVGVHTGKGFSREVARGAMLTASGLGMSWSEVRYRPGEAREVTSRIPSGDVLAVVGSFQDELDILQAVDLNRWKAVLSVAAGVDEVLQALGDRREGLIGPAQWTPGSSPPPVVGPDADWLVSAYRRRVGVTPPYPATQAVAAAVIWSECVRRSGTLEEDALLAQARRLVTRTLFGAFRVDPVTGLQAGHRVVTVQWQKGRRRVVWPPEFSEANLARL